MNEKIITKLLEFQTSNWNISRIRIDPRNLPADSCFVSLYLPESGGLASATDHFLFFVTLCGRRRHRNVNKSTIFFYNTGKDILFVYSFRNYYFAHLSSTLFDVSRMVLSE